MSYRLLDIELTDPLPDVYLPGSDSGTAILWRRESRPVGFDIIPGVFSREDFDKMAALYRNKGWDQTAAVSDPLDTSLTVAVCTRNRTAELERCLESLQQLRPGITFRLEILVVDNAPSDDSTRHLVFGRPGVRYIREKRPGLNVARNRALHESRSEYIAFIDDDVMVDPIWLTGFVETFREIPDAAAFTGLVLPAELETEAQFLFERLGGFRFAGNGFQKRLFDSNSRHGFFYPLLGVMGVGANMIVHRVSVLQLGGFDEALDTGSTISGGGDTDILYRLVVSGRPIVYSPHLLVFHRHRRTMEQLRRQTYGWSLGYMAFVSKLWTEQPSFRLVFLVASWTLYHLWKVGKSITFRSLQPLSLARAELSGGLAGLSGAYRRSKVQMDRSRGRYEAAGNLVPTVSLDETTGL